MTEEGLQFYLSKIIDDFCEATKNMMDQCAPGQIELASMFHYTNSYGLHGIIDSGAIWATERTNLNDPTDLVWGLHVGLDELDKLASPADPLVSFFRRVLRTVLEPFELPFSGFVTSFSRSGDSLPQWRAYADNGRGFALKIAARALDHASLLASTQDPLLLVTYDDAELRQRQRAACQLALECLGDSRVKEGLRAAYDAGCNAHNEFMSQLSTKLTRVLLWHSLQAKHPAYASEEEIRKIHFDQRGILEGTPRFKTRSRGSGIVSFLEQPLSPIGKECGWLLGVHVGPAASDATAAEVSNFLRARGLSQVEVTKSKIPYRTSS